MSVKLHAGNSSCCCSDSSRSRFRHSSCCLLIEEMVIISSAIFDNHFVVQVAVHGVIGLLAIANGTGKEDNTGHHCFRRRSRSSQSHGRCSREGKSSYESQCRVASSVYLFIICSFVRLFNFVKFLVGDRNWVVRVGLRLAWEG